MRKREIERVSDRESERERETQMPPTRSINQWMRRIFTEVWSLCKIKLELKSYS